MFTARIPSHKIDRPRIDPEFYSPDKLEALNWLNGWHDRLVTLEKLSPKITDGTHITPEYVEEGIRFLSSTNINCCSIDFLKTQFISVQAYKDFAKSNCNPEYGDLLISKNGKIGTAAQFLESHPQCSLFVSVALVRKPEHIDRDYLAIFLNSKGGWSQFSRASKTGVITNLHLEEIREVEVVQCDPEAQLYIGDKVRQSEKFRTFASLSFDFAITSIEQLIDLEISESDIENHVRSGARRTDDQISNEHRKHNRTSPASIVGRIDAWHYQPHLTKAYEQIQKSGQCYLLHAIIDPERDIKGGATPLGAEYTQSGTIRFYRTSDVHGLSVRLSGTAFISEEQDHELSRSRLQAGDVLLTITGADFGHAGVITADHLPGNISQHSVRFRPTVDSDYLVAYLESFYGQQMLWRQAYGATRPAIDYPGVRSLLIRVPRPSVQKVIGDSVRAGIKARELSNALIVAARLIVEAMIERRVTEDELIYAQTRLELGDESADRAILSRLYEGGLDATDTRPLFPDLDAYYETLQMVEREQTEIAAK